MINKENYEEYLCSYVDGELNEAETKALLLFLEVHPELKEELTAFESTKLQPDTTVVFEDKKTLFKKDGAILISFNNWKTLSAAAGLALLLGFSWKIWKDDNKNNTQPIVKNETPAIIKKDTLQTLPKHEEAFVVKEKKKHKINLPQELIIEEPPVLLPQEYIAAIPSRVYNGEPVSPVLAPTHEISLAINTIDFNTQIPQENEKKNLLDRLHYDHDKQASMQEVAQAFSSKIDQVKSFSQNLKETTFAFHFGGRDYLLNH